MTVTATKMPAERFRVSIVSGERFPGLNEANLVCYIRATPISTVGPKTIIFRYAVTALSGMLRLSPPADVLDSGLILHQSHPHPARHNPNHNQSRDPMLDLEKDLEK
jgi:hypothetical protein